MSGATRNVDDVTGLVGYVLIRRHSGALQVERIFDTEPEGAVVGEVLDRDLQLKNGDTVEGIIPAAQTRVGE